MCEQYTQPPLIAIKRCTKCGEAKPLSDFQKQADRPSGHRAHCKKCCAEYSAAYNRANAGKVKARRDAIAETRAARMRAYYRANAERVKARMATYYDANAEAVGTRVAAYRAAHLDVAREIGGRHRARKRNAAINDFTARQWEELKEEYDGKCAYCGCAPAVLTQDHVVPLSRGGNHTKSNIVPACQPCNASKQDHLLDEWRGPRW